MKSEKPKKSKEAWRYEDKILVINNEVQEICKVAQNNRLEVVHEVNYPNLKIY